MHNAPAVTPAEILLVEDNEDYVFFARQAFEKTELPVNLHHVDNGKKCLEFLRQQPPYSAAAMPDIVLLDLDMSVMDGRQVLAEIVKDEALKHLPVVVFTARDERAEILRMYQLRCSSYICKPADVNKYGVMIKKFADYWLSVATLPTRGRAIT